MADEQIRSSLVQQHRQGFDQRAGQAAHEMGEIEVARAADAQATKRRINDNQAACMQLLEAELRAVDQQQEQQERLGVVQEEGRARGRREFTILEGRVRASLLSIYWERAEEIDRWSVAM